VTDELIFQDAKKDTAAKEAYKSVINMNEVMLFYLSIYLSFSTSHSLFSTACVALQIVDIESGRDWPDTECHFGARNQNDANGGAHVQFECGEGATGPQGCEGGELEAAATTGVSNTVVY
jgi:hypothetical protein